MTDTFNTVAQPLNEAPPDTAPHWLRMEHAISLGQAGLAELGRLGTASGFTCPDCGGALFEMREGKPVRFLCHTDHAFSALSLASSQSDVAEEALWAAIRALQEKEAMLRRIAEFEATGNLNASAVLAEAIEIGSFVDKMRTMVVVQAPREPIEDDCPARRERLDGLAPCQPPQRRGLSDWRRELLSVLFACAKAPYV